MSQQYFGVDLRHGKYGFKMTRENYAIIDRKCTTHSKNSNYYETFWGDDKKEEFLKIYEDTSAVFYTESYCERKKERALINYDLNIAYFASLDSKKFNSALKKFIRKNRRFKEISNLNVVDDKAGYYVMVLDEYKQIYIGTSNNLKKRVMSHWSKRKQFDRLIFGKVETSKLSIDSFRAFDTTRIFVYVTEDTFSIEDKFIRSIPDEYCCNRTGGGIPEFGELTIIAKAKYRDLE